MNCKLKGRHYSTSLTYIVLFFLLFTVCQAEAANIVSVKTEKNVYVANEPVYILYVLKGLEAGYGLNLSMSLEMPDGTLLFLGDNAQFAAWHPIWIVRNFPFSPVNIKAGQWPLMLNPDVRFVPGRYVLNAEVYDAATEVMLDRSSSEFYLVNAPYIDHLEPAQGVTGDIVRLKGEKFGNNPDIVKVMMGGREATIMEIEESSVVVWVPYGAETGEVTVAVDGAVSNPVDFLVGPYVESVSRTVLAPGDKVTIKGFNFAKDVNLNYVYFNGVRGTVKKATETQLDVLVPDGNTGPLHVVVNEMKSNAQTVTITPVVESLTPPTGNEGDTVTISGWNFNPVKTNNYVVFNAGTDDETAASILEASSTQLLVRVPAAESGKVYVYTDGEAAKGDLSFTYPPVTTDISPSEIMAGDSLTITGMNFDDVEQKNTVTVGGQTLTVTSALPHEIKARTPVNLQSGAITVTVNGLSSMEAQFLTVYPGPVVSSVSPSTMTSGDTSTEIELTGVGFVSGLAVKLASNDSNFSPGVTIRDYNTAVFKLPAGARAGSYDLTVVRNVAGRTLTSNTMRLTVQ